MPHVAHGKTSLREHLPYACPASVDVGQLEARSDGYTNSMVVPQRFAPGMAMQLARFHDALAGGMPRRGWKIGINVPEMLGRLDLPHPGVGWLDGRSVFSTGAELQQRCDAKLHVEPEIAVSLSKAVPPGCSAKVARNCIAAVHPALEIVNYAQPSSGLDDVVAHCMFHEAAVVGPPAPFESARGLGSEFPILRVGTRLSEPPRVDLVPTDLGEIVAFVAEYLAAFGQSLEPHDLILSGSYTAKAVAIEATEEAVAQFGVLGTVRARVVA